MTRGLRGRARRRAGGLPITRASSSGGRCGGGSGSARSERTPTRPRRGQRVVEEHSEQRTATRRCTSSSRGRATFTLGGDEVDAPAGTLVFARPGTKRGAIAAEDGTAVLAVGAKPGEVFEPSPWEDIFAAFSLRGPGRDRAGARARRRRASSARPDDWQGYYNAACFEVLHGDSEAGVAHLQRAHELEPERVARGGSEGQRLRRRSATTRASRVASGSPARAADQSPGASRRRSRNAGTGSCSGRATSSTAPCSSPASASTSSCSPTASANALWRGRRRTARAPPAGEPGEDVAVGDAPHRDVGDERRAVRARDADRERVRAGQRRAAVGRGEPPRRGRGQRRDEAAVGEAAHPVAERSRSGSSARRRRPARARAARRAPRRRSPPASGSRARRRRPSARSPGSATTRSAAARPGRVRQRLEPVDAGRARGSCLPRRSASRKWSASVRSRRPRRAKPSAAQSRAARCDAARTVSVQREEPGSRLLSMPARPARLRRGDRSAIRTIARDGSDSGSAQHERLARVAALAQPRVERDRAEQRHAELRREPLAAARAEDLGGHVLDHAEQPHVRLLRHHRRPRRRPPARAAAASSR